MINFIYFYAMIMDLYLCFQNKLRRESEQLHLYASECSDELQKRETPLWVRATVGLFKTYF